MTGVEEADRVNDVREQLNQINQIAVSASERPHKCLPTNRYGVLSSISSWWIGMTE
jgi:hypothetical protein